MKNSKPLCVIACIIALVLGFSALAQAQTGNNKGVQYYQCKDLRGRISLQQQPCTGAGVTQTEINMDGTPKAADKSPAAGVTADSDVSQQAAELARRYAALDENKLMEKLQNARSEKPLVLVAIFVLALFAIWNGLVLIYLAFSQSFWWGLGYLFVPLVGLVYVIMYWHDTKKPFLINLFTGILAGVIAALYL